MTGASEVAPRRAAWAVPLFALGVLALALATLRHELRAYNYHTIARAAWALPHGHVLTALALTVVAYLVLPGYDALGLRYARHPLSAGRTILASMIAYAFSQNLGFAFVTGGAVRFRFWTAWGLSSTEIARAVAFAGLTFWIGIVSVAGVMLLAEPVPAGLARFVGWLPLHSLAPVGGVLVGAVIAYLALNIVRRRPVRVRGWAFEMPGLLIALAQVAVSTLDWAIAAAVAFVLLPPARGLGYPEFLGMFVLAQALGLVSHVPGGLGVFETLMIVLLAPFLPAPAVLASLLVYRAVYYLVPFFVAAVVLAVHEAHRRRQAVATAARVTAQIAGRWGPALIPHVLSLTTFAGGMILLVSGATPSVRGRVSALRGVLPLGIVELSHFAGSLAGAALIILAWAIRRRLDAAYGLTVGVLSIGIAASLLKGLDWEEALALAVVLAILLPNHRAFYRKAALTAEPLSPGWIVAITVAVGTSIALGLFSYKHVEYAGDLWWRFGAHADAPRFLRASVGAGGVLVLVAMSRLLRHGRVEPDTPSADDLARARAIACVAPETTAHLALVGDKALLFSESGQSMIMYGVAGRSWVALGDPIGPAEERAELAWRFREEADRHGAWTVFYQIGTDNLPLYIDLGLTLLKLGEEAIVPLDGFSLDGGNRKSMRRVYRDAQKRGASFEVVAAEAVPPLLPTLRAISDDWLAAKKTREKSFSLGRFDDAYLRYFPMALVRVDGEIVAFANLWCGGGKAELSVDLMRYSTRAPEGLMQYLFTELLLWGRDQGYDRFNLGMAPLSGLENRQLAPLWSRVGAFLYRHGEDFYNFQGLRLYKDKFDPVWEPRYLASPGGLALPRILANVAALISGGLRGVVSK